MIISLSINGGLGLVLVLTLISSLHGRDSWKTKKTKTKNNTSVLLHGCLVGTAISHIHLKKDPAECICKGDQNLEGLIGFTICR